MITCISNMAITNRLTKKLKIPLKQHITQRLWPAHSGTSYKPSYSNNDQSTRRHQNPFYTESILTIE